MIHFSRNGRSLEALFQIDVFVTEVSLNNAIQTVNSAFLSGQSLKIKLPQKSRSIKLTVSTDKGDFKFSEEQDTLQKQGWFEAVDNFNLNLFYNLSEISALADANSATVDKGADLRTGIIIPVFALLKNFSPNY